MQGACGVHAVVKGGTLPSCGVRRDRVNFAQLGASAGSKVAICHVVPLSQKSLPLCGNASYDLSYASHTRLPFHAEKFDHPNGFKEVQTFV